VEKLISLVVPTNQFIFLLSLLVILQMNVSSSKMEVINFFLKVMLEGIDLSVDLSPAFTCHCFFAHCCCSWLIVLVLCAMSFGCSFFAQCHCSLHFSHSSLHNVVGALFLCTHQHLALGSLLDVGFFCTISGRFFALSLVVLCTKSSSFSADSAGDQSATS